MSNRLNRPWWRDAWPTWHEPFTHAISGALGGSIAVGIGLIVAGYGVWFISLLAIPVAAAIAGFVALWLTMFLRWLLRSGTPNIPKQSLATWSFASIPIAWLGIELSPFVNDNLILDVVAVVICCAIVGILDALLLRLHAHHDNRAFLNRYRRAGMP